MTIRPPLNANRSAQNEEDWWFAALCRGRGEQVDFFPGPGYDHEPARVICRDCRVRHACLTDALSRRDHYGVWGGTVPEERRLAVALGWDATRTIRFVDSRRRREKKG